MGAEVILHPTMTGTIDREIELSIARAMATVNQCFFFDVNGLDSGGSGKSIVCGPDGRIIYEAGSTEEIFPLELNTMPGWAGSSWYFNRYMDANNAEEFAGKEALNYWKDVDLYIGGSEHATGHLLYSRFWQKFLFDKGFVPVEEYANKLINQGMILGTSAFVCRIEGENKFISKDIAKDKKVQLIHADVSFVNASDELDIEAFKNWRPEFKDVESITEKDGTFKVSREVEKMSKSKYNVVNPDDICNESSKRNGRRRSIVRDWFQRKVFRKSCQVHGLVLYLRLHPMGQLRDIRDQEGKPILSTVIHRDFKPFFIVIGRVP